MNRPNEAPLPEPLAYFLTWHTYGTWLPGDERGWTEYRAGFQRPDAVRKRKSAEYMTEAACILGPKQRELVEQTITDHCRLRRWTLHVVNCRSNHMHVVVSADKPPEVVRDQFKAWCTRKLKELQIDSTGSQGEAGPRVREKWWTERGSQRYINDDEALEAAIQYVRDLQDGPH